MTYFKTRVAMAVLLGSVLAPLQSMASNTLSGDEVKKLIVGNTAHGKAPNGKSMKNYFDPSGALVRSVNGKIVEGSYSISGDGTQCIKVGGADNCGKITNNGDGTYNRVSAEGKVLLKWEIIVNGKDVP